ncbi:MAG TPA: hypothetical protein RMH99_00750 [Sandaracinaceae bacterium LLY-WYZ-13_1]|nr:hypothetical protein [Sandaracinaceae bacterium LLY-WYZ-13_1]
MSEALREAARRALAEVQASAEGEVTRLTVDVAVQGRSELVTLALRDGELAWTSTGDPEGPHVAAALRWLAASDPERAATDSAEMQRVSWIPGEPEPEPAVDAQEPTARTRLADALEDVVTMVVRAGAGEPDAPSVAESLERLRREAPLPTPTGLSRWLGRLREALAAKDLTRVARLLDGARQLAEDLRRDRPTPAARRRVVGWMGAGGEVGPVERLSDRTLLEVAREWLPASERGGIERRYLVDLQNGEVFREERSRSTPVASVGPCPRLVTVGLAEVEDSAAPRRIRLMQYAVGLELGRDEIGRVGASAYRRFSALADRYRAWMADHPGQAEPFAVVAPQRWSEEEIVGYDDDGEPLPLARADDPGAVDVLGQMVSAQGPVWLAGRLVDVEGALMMVPCALAVPDGGGSRLHRLR